MRINTMSVMIRTAASCVILMATLAFTTASCQNKSPDSGQTDGIARLLGDWSGESICVNKEKFPACNDEKVVYHITRVADKPNTIHLSADKIVDGKPDNMGAFDFVYDPKKQSLTSEYKTDRVDILMEFTLKDDVLDGTMTSLPDKTQARRMTVKKDKK